MYIQLILNDHCHETELWPWGGEPIYRNGKYVGMCTTTGYGFTFKKQVFFYKLYRFFNYINVVGMLRVCRKL